MSLHFASNSDSALEECSSGSCEAGVFLVASKG